MQSCPQCKSTRIRIEGETLWTSHCEDCGFNTSGTASFPLVVEEVEEEYDLVFYLSSPKQIPIVRGIAQELLIHSSADLLEMYRENDSRISVSSITMWRARDYIRESEALGIQATVKNQEA